MRQPVPMQANNVTRLAYSFDEASAATGLSRRTLERAVARGDLRRKKVGSRSIIPASDLAAFCGARRQRQQVLAQMLLAGVAPFSFSGASK
jgi:excisionase family DNA binding protein